MLEDGTPKCGSWSAQRRFVVYLPPGYDPAKPYPLVIEGPGCGGGATDVYSLANGQSTVIRVGIAPGPNSTGHATNPQQGCFDDHEGDDSIDWVFYEQLYDKLNAELCFDRHRVFVGGHSSGGALANQLSGKYAGDSIRPVRGALVYGAVVPTEPAQLPTFSDAPIAGIWLHELANMTTPFENTERAVSRAMQLAHCPGGDYQHAQLEDFPIGAGMPDSTCQRLSGCDSLYPLVVCPLAGHAQGIHDSQVNPAFTEFLRLFGKEPLITMP
jgi:poly(3-hydroxybutyrate) depolymerase